jgi:tRNA threonylcarbamoyladenosine biosynthesis protein TsaE
LKKLSIFLPSPEDTARLGRWFGERLSPGDTLLLQGQIGSGKTHFSRAAVQACLGIDEDVPSPTFTLVQTYGSGEAEIWHADLYRLTHPDEVMELGLGEAFGKAICLIEWPERLADDSPNDALRIMFEVLEDGRCVHIVGGRIWTDRICSLQCEWNA